MNVYLWSTEVWNLLWSTWIEGIYLGTDEVLWGEKITIQFDKHSSYDYCSFSESSIKVPVWTKLLIPTITLPIDNTQPFYLDFYRWNSRIKRVTVYNGNSWQYIYTPVSVYINDEIWYRQEWEMIEFKEDSIVKVETTNSTTDKSSSIEFVDTYATFESSTLRREFSGQWKLFSYGSAPQHWGIYWNTSTNSLQTIHLDGPNGTSANIDSLTAKEWYKVMWLTVVDNIGGTWVVIDSTTSSYVIPVNSNLTLEPKVIEWISYPYYWFDSCWENNTPYLWYSWMQNNTQFTNYVKNMVNNLAWFTPSWLNMYWSFDEIFYVEWLDKQWNVSTKKVYCFMYWNFWNSQTSSSTTIYFVVDITSYDTVYYNYSSVYPSTITYTDKNNLCSAIMTRIMWWECVWWVMSANSYDFSTNAARNLYQTDSATYQRKLAFYESLKTDANSTYSWITLI